VTAIFDIERIPEPGLTETVQFATASSPYDPMALKIYTLVKNEMPCACKVTMNPLGEWFDSVMQVISDVAPAVGTALSPIFPPAGAIGGLAGRAAALAAQENAKARNRKKNQKKLTSASKKGPRRR
jgi:hypothetical protein